MASLGAEREVQKGMKKRGCVNGPLHHGPGKIRYLLSVMLIALFLSVVPVALCVELGQKLVNWQYIPVGENVLEVEKLKGCARGLVEEDHKERNEAEPELAGPQFARAAAANLHEECPPGEEEHNDRQAEGHQVAGDIEIIGAREPFVVCGVHADLEKLRVVLVQFDPIF